MRRALVLTLVAALAFVACRQIAGIDTITYSDSGSDDGGCPTPVPLFTSSADFDRVLAQGGFAYLEVTSSGVMRCPGVGCANPMNVVTVPPPATGTWESFALGSALLYYTYQGTPVPDGGTNGALHSVGLDGTGDLQVASPLAFPSWVATSGAKVFWVDDPIAGLGTTPATVNCIGCSGPTSTPWMTQLNQTYALIADQNTVYVLTDDGTTTSTEELLACSVQTACGASARKVATGVAFTTGPTSLASDGTYAYIARQDHTDVIRVDALGTVVEVVTGLNVVAIALDPGNNDLYFATDSGFLYRTRPDGSTKQPVQITCGLSIVTAIAVDAQNVYILQSPGTATNATPFSVPKGVSGGG